MLSRWGATLIELLVAIALAGIVLAAATSSLFRQQRTSARIGSVARAEAQLRAATSVLASQLAFIDEGSGDLAAGAARDTAIQFRATVAVALACDRSVGAVTLFPVESGKVPLGGMASEPRPGDSLWFLADTNWRGARIEAIASVNAVCPAPGGSTGPTTRLVLAGATDTIPALTPLRVTRPSRFSFYRSADGSWQLGYREWNDASGSFSTPQPVAGPFLRSPDGRSSLFRYFDADATEIPPAEIGTSRVARIRVITHALAPGRERGQDSVRGDSIDIALQHARAR
ncbi:MAG: type II secretion system GspH family protein [Gemmatimonadota bacterium]|nr:type II secretion system GspH family protein [Gemmatimonadota bacterium]